MFKVSKVLLGVFGFFLSLTLSVSGYSKSTAHLYFKNSIIDTNEISALLESVAVPTSLVAQGKAEYFVVQFEGTTSAQFKKEIQKYAKVVRYIPDNGFIVKLKTSTMDLDRLKHLQWYGAYSSFLKIEKSLLLSDRNKVVSLNLFLFSDVSQKTLRQISQFSEKVLDTAAILVKVQAKVSQIAKLASLSEVEWIEQAKNATFGKIRNLKSGFSELPVSHDFDQFDGYASGAKILNADDVYALGIAGSSETVTITDSGLDLGDGEDMHKDLEGRIAGAYAVGRPESGRWDDPIGHGTHVAGLVAGDGTLSEGKVTGLAYESSLIMQSVFKWVSQGGILEKSMFLPARIDKLFEGPFEDGSRIHTNSWQFENSGGEYSVQSALLDYFIWEHPDYVVLFAAGNDGVDLNANGQVDRGSISSPATAKNCITVGASENLISEGGIQKPWGLIGQMGPDPDQSIWGAAPLKLDLPSDDINGIAAFSSRGPTADGRIKPDVVAPGTNNLSLKSRAEEMNADETWGLFNDDYAFMGGTSMATPLVAGAAALVRQYYTEQENREYVSAALVKATLINGSQDMYPGQHGDFKRARPNYDEGFGRVDVSNALVPKKGARVSIDETDGIEDGKRKRYEVKVKDPSETLSITLVYSDFPASPAVAKALVNDLDLKIIDKDGKVYYPNGRDKPDHTNNVEHIDIKAPQKGAYVIEVSGHAVPIGYDDDGKQPFALVVSGGL